LPGTRLEVESIARLFNHKTVLLGEKATVRAISQLAADNQLQNYHYLHFATHGVYLESKRKNIILNPALILPDGELTTEKLLWSWNLDADLVVLSACDAGLGMHGEGTGHFGFQETLLFCGARAVMVSMWKVEDYSTALLMSRFYENMLGARPGVDGRMAKGRALAEAKRWLRSLPRNAPEFQPLRGLDRGKIQDLDPGEGKNTPYEHPRHWASFVLVGDYE
jgi:CHAT domain-containing protein